MNVCVCYVCMTVCERYSVCYGVLLCVYALCVFDCVCTMSVSVCVCYGCVIVCVRVHVLWVWELCVDALWVCVYVYVHVTHV